MALKRQVISDVLAKYKDTKQPIVKELLELLQKKNDNLLNDDELFELFNITLKTKAEALQNAESLKLPEARIVIIKAETASNLKEEKLKEAKEIVAVANAKAVRLEQARNRVAEKNAKKDSTFQEAQKIVAAAETEASKLEKAKKLTESNPQSFDLSKKDVTKNPALLEAQKIIATADIEAAKLAQAKKIIAVAEEEAKQLKAARDLVETSEAKLVEQSLEIAEKIYKDLAQSGYFELTAPSLFKPTPSQGNRVPAFKGISLEDTFGMFAIVCGKLYESKILTKSLFGEMAKKANLIAEKFPALVKIIEALQKKGELKEDGFLFMVQRLGELEFSLLFEVGGTLVDPKNNLSLQQIIEAKIDNSIYIELELLLKKNELDAKKVENIMKDVVKHRDVFFNPKVHEALTTSITEPLFTVNLLTRLVAQCEEGSTAEKIQKVMTLIDEIHKSPENIKEIKAFFDKKDNQPLIKKAMEQNPDAVIKVLNLLLEESQKQKFESDSVTNSN